MTNGEKIETILDVDKDCTEVHGENGTMTFTVTQDFWNAEYKEPRKALEQEPCDKQRYVVRGINNDKIEFIDKYSVRAFNRYIKFIKDSCKYEAQIEKKALEQEPKIDLDELKCKILMEVDGGTDDKWLRYANVCDNISKSIDEYSRYY